MRYGVVICAAAAAIFAGSAAAQLSAEQTVGYLDLDKDSKVSLNEYLNFQLPHLKQYDASGNGELSRAEFKASLAADAQKNAEKSFKAFDNDRDNGLSQAEFLGYHAFVFKNYLDLNRDGFITVEEWRKVLGG